MPCDTGWQPQDDGSYTRTLHPVNGHPSATVVATATDGLSPVNLQRAVRIVIRHPATRHALMVRFYHNLRVASRHLDLLLEADALAALWLTLDLPVPATR